MNKKLLEELKKRLEEQKENLEKELEKIADKDKNFKGDWDSRFPQYESGSGGQILEDAADQVEEYTTRLPIEFSMELRLKNIAFALEKIKKGKYGICEGCGKKISEERLKAFPEARLCMKCGKKE
jgi:DnaK suppressor protein